MHWFWRAAIAVGVGGVTAFVLIPVVEDLMRVYLGTYPPVAVVVLSGIVIPQSVCLLTFIALMRRYGPFEPLERETRCRKCHYILRGITEPRCPECGEAI